MVNQVSGQVVKADGFQHDYRFQNNIRIAEKSLSEALAHSDEADKNKDFKLSSDEVYAYYQNHKEEIESKVEKEDSKSSLWKKIAIGAGVALTFGVAGYLAYKGIKNLKSAQAAVNEATKATESVATSTAGFSAEKTKALVEEATNNSRTNYQAIADSLVSKPNTPAQHAQLQAAYDELGAKLEKGAEFFNPRTGNTIRYNNSIENVVVSKNGFELMELDNAPQGYRRITRTLVDGKDYLHKRNSITDYWTTRKRLDGKIGMSGWNLDQPFINTPASRTPVGSKLNLLTKTEGGMDVRITNTTNDPNKVLATFYKNGAVDGSFSITPKDLLSKFGIKLS